MDSFNYPEKYGKNAPSFARATKTEIGGKTVVFVSGTASIRGSESVPRDDKIKQTDITIENIETMLIETGVLEEVERGNFTIEKIIYIKNKESFNKIKKHIQTNHPLFDEGIYLLSNVCREELDVEISFTAVEGC